MPRLIVARTLFTHKLPEEPKGHVPQVV